MKKVLILAGLCLALGGLAFGQWTQQARVSVPFEFVVGNTVLPAGTYSVSTPFGGTDQIMINNAETGATAVATNIDVSGKDMYNENSNLVFVLDPSGRRVLHQIWIKSQSHGHDLVHEKGLPEPK